MEFLENLVNSVNGFVWGPAMLVLILGTGFILMVMLKFMPLRRLGTGFAFIWRGREKGDESTGEISPFQALMTCLAATVGTGNIAGVATAIFLGGPGALFWMWCTALVGMARLLALHSHRRRIAVIDDVAAQRTAILQVQGRDRLCDERGSEREGRDCHHGRGEAMYREHGALLSG